MDNTLKKAPVNMEDLEGYSKVLHNKGIGNVGTCSTAADTAAKTVTLGNTFSLVEGAMAIIKFTNGISVANATLAVGEGAAKSIYLRGAALDASTIKAGDSVMMRYNGTQWDIVGGVGGEQEADTAYIGEYDSTAPAPDFDAYADTLHVTAQTLNSTKKAQARTNIDVYSKAEIGAMRAPSYNPLTKGIVFPATAAFSYDSQTKGITISV